MSTFSRSSHGPARRRAPLLLLLFVPVLLVLATAVLPQRALAQTKIYHTDQFNSDITVNQDGSLDVTETIDFVYDQGQFHFGNRYWDTSRIDSITDLHVYEVVNGQRVEYRDTGYVSDGGAPGTFGTTTENGQDKVQWWYNYTDQPKEFVLQYHVNGGVKVYPDHDEFDWYAVPPDWGSSVNRSRVTASFPSGFDTSTLAGTSNIQSVPQAETSAQGNTITWTAGGIQSGGLEVGAKIPAGVLNATKPGWQDAIDRQNNYDKSTRPLVDLAVLALSLLVVVGGVLWVIMRWYSKGRDKPVKLYSDYVNAPPSNLPPGLVGTLLDESADVRDVIATVVDQGRKGNLTIQETEQGGLFTSTDFEYTQTGNKVDFQYEDMVLNAIFVHGNPVRLSDLKNTFYTALPPIYDEMYRTLVALKYFPENPKSVRVRNAAEGTGFFVLAAIAAALAFFFAGGVSFALWGFPIAFAVIGIALMATSGAMPRKTDMGAEEAAKWRAFGRYLEDMKRYTNVQAAADKFQQYLPYAVAMGIEKQLIHQFDQVPTALPPYYRPYGYGPVFYPYPIGTYAGGQTAAPGGSGGAMPQLNPAEAMQGMSNSLAGAMQGMSNSFTSMVNSASNALTSQPAPQGGSGGMGGGGWGGGGGGGGGFGGGGGGGGGGGAG